MNSYLRSHKKSTRVSISADIIASTADCEGESNEYCFILEPPLSMLNLRSLELGENAGSGLARNFILLISVMTSRLEFLLPPCISRMIFFTSADEKNK